MAPDLPLDRIRSLARAAHEAAIADKALALGKLTDTQLAGARARADESGASLKEVLIDGGLLAPTDWTSVARTVHHDDFTGPARQLPALPDEVRAALAFSHARLDEFVLVETIGRGGGGEIWKAWDTALGRWVALKRPVLDSTQAKERFARESLTVARLEHPAIVPIYRVGGAPGSPYLVMPLIEGTTLVDADLSLADALNAVRVAALAVEHAHQRGVVHRDLKPGNIMRDEQGRILVLDFGIVHLLGASTAMTAPGDVLGTAAYMAPEQARGDAQAIGKVTDIYALGATLYELVTRHPPFAGGSVAEIVHKVIHDVPISVRRRVPSLPSDVAAIIETAMAHEPHRRYASAHALAEDLGHAIAGEAVSVRPSGRLAPLRRLLRRHPLVLALAVVATAAVLAAGAVATRENGARRSAVESVRQMAEMSLDAALRLRRSGDNQSMRQFVPRLAASYQEARLRAPDLAELDFLMGRMFRAVLDDDTALEYQGRALQKSPDYGPALYEHAVLLSKRYGQLLGEAQAAARRDEEPGRWPAEPGHEDLDRRDPRLRDLRAAIVRDCRALERVLASDPRATAARGIFAYHQGDSEQGRLLLEQTVARDPGLEEAWEALALALAAARRTEEAEEVYTRAIAFDRGYVPHLLGRARLRGGRAIAKLGRGTDADADFAGALADVTAAIELAPESVSGWMARGLIHVQVANHRLLGGGDPVADATAAERDFGHVLTRSSNNLEALEGRAMARGYRGTYHGRGGRRQALDDFAAALADSRSVLAAAPGQRSARLQEGRLRINRAAYLALAGADPRAECEAAVAALDETLRGDARNEEAIAWRAYALAQAAAYAQNKGADPSSYLSKAEESLGLIGVGPMAIWTRFRRAFVAIIAGENAARDGRDPTTWWRRGEEDLRSVIEELPELADVWLRRGVLRARRADHALRTHRDPQADRTAAAADLDRAVSLNPRRADTFLERSALRRQMGDRKGAEMDRRRATELAGGALP